MKKVTSEDAPVVIRHPKYGEFVYDESTDYYDGEIECMDEPIEFSIESENCFGTLEHMCNDLSGFIGKAKAYAATKLTETANDWAKEEDEFADIVTEKDFANHIVLSGVNIDEEGEYALYFDDDDMFLGHSIVVSGNEENGFSSATIEG